MYINPKDNIKLSNVVSKKYKFHIKDMEKILFSFLKEIDNNNLIPQGLCFYTINNIPLDEIIEGEFFISVKNELVDELNGLEFQTYFSIENMISTCIYGDFESNTEKAYYVLLKYIEENNLTQITPIFNVMAGDRELQYVYIKVGVAQKLENKEYFN